MIKKRSVFVCFQLDVSVELNVKRGVVQIAVYFYPVTEVCNKLCKS